MSQVLDLSDRLCDGEVPACLDTYMAGSRIIFMAIGTIGDVVPLTRVAAELRKDADCQIAFASHTAHTVHIVLCTHTSGSNLGLANRSWRC